MVRPEYPAPALQEVSGDLSSCDTLATKLRRVFSYFPVLCERIDVGQVLDLVFGIDVSRTSKLPRASCAVAFVTFFSVLNYFRQNYRSAQRNGAAISAANISAVHVRHRSA
jgi:hypothetical protein